jgi:hypothetical protein
MGGSATSASTPLRLYCLGGGEAPPNLAGDLGVIPALPVEARQKLWQALGPTLAETLSADTEKLLELFCVAYRVDEQDLGRVLAACRFVIREAAAHDVLASALAEDLERLCPEEPLVKDLVLAGYEPAKAHLRQEMTRAAVTDHGKLLVGLNWRVDAIQTSERGAGLRVPVALVTLHYREGGEAGQMTLQALPDMVGELRRACDRILGG